MPRINDSIHVPKVRVIGQDGKMLGILKTDEASLRMKRLPEPRF